MKINLLIIAVKVEPGIYYKNDFVVWRKARS